MKYRKTFNTLVW